MVGSVLLLSLDGCLVKGALVGDSVSDLVVGELVSAEVAGSSASYSYNTNTGERRFKMTFSFEVFIKVGTYHQ